MTRAVIGEFRHIDPAGLAGKDAARMEAAARRRVHRARNVTFEQRALAHHGRIRLRDSREQGACVGVARAAEELIRRRGFDDLAGDGIDRDRLLRLGRSDQRIQVEALRLLRG